MVVFQDRRDSSGPGRTRLGTWKPGGGAAAGLHPKLCCSLQPGNCLGHSHMLAPHRPRITSPLRVSLPTAAAHMSVGSVCVALVCWSLAVSRSCATGVSCPTGRLYPSESVGLCVAPFCCAVGESVTRAAQARLSPPSRHVRIWRSSPQRPTQPSPTATWTWNGCLPCSQPAQNHPTRPTTRTRQR